MKHLPILLICLSVLFACEKTKTEDLYTISGKVSDAASSGKRLQSGLYAKVTERSGNTIYEGPLELTDTISRRYSLKDIPAGEYEITYGGKYYEPARHKLNVRGDANLDVELTPVRLFSLDKEELTFGTRVNELAFSITNISDNSVDVFIRSDIGLCHRRIQPEFKKLAPGETTTVSVEIAHLEEGLAEGSVKVFAGSPQEWVDTVIPVKIETTSKDFYANLVGKVVDKQGNPLKDVLISYDFPAVTALTDENGNYSIDDLPYKSTFNVTALPEYYLCQESEFIDYKIDEIVVNFSLDPCANHLVFDRREVDFGTGSISRADGNLPEIIHVNITPETDAPVFYRLFVYNTEFGTVPGLTYSPTSQYVAYFPELTFQLSRSDSNEGSFLLKALLRTDTAGAYVIPVKFTNTP